MLEQFHPAVATWFAERFGMPTEAQTRGWAEIASGRDTLIMAPTGSGKTLAAFLAGIDALVRRAVGGELDDVTRIVYVSPLKALGADVERNLEAPLRGIEATAMRLGTLVPPIRTALRTGDTSQTDRARIVRRPPHVLITTPESLYLLLTSDKGRGVLCGAETVIVDEIHALVGNKRGAHLALSLERLDALCAAQPGARGRRKPTRIGLSATVHAVDEVARFLVGADTGGAAGRARPCRIVDAGRKQPLDITVEVPKEPLSAVASREAWKDVHERVGALIAEHKTTLIFVPSRRMCERVAHDLEALLGKGIVAAHHGALAKRTRLSVERKLQSGQLRAVVATASLELGIDIGDVELVCQLGSPRSIAVLRQRIGRAHHAVGGTPKGRIFAMTRDELCECAAAARAMVRGQIDRHVDRPAPLDVLAQQLVATCATADFGDDALYALVRGAAPYAALSRAEFDDVLAMLGDGIATRRGRSGAHLHLDRVNRRVRGRRGARIAALTSGGAIPDKADYVVVEDPTEAVVGTLDEDFAIESMAGDIFLLGSHSWRIRRVEAGVVRVEDAAGLPPTVPFWNGEGLARTAELSREVARAAPGAVGAAGRARARAPRRRLQARARRRRPGAAVRGRRRAGARRGADAIVRGRRALLRRGRRHAAGHPRAVRRARQPRLGPGAAQEVLSRLRLRAAGRGVGRRDPAVDRPAAQLPAGRDLRLRHPGHRRGDAGAGGAAVADVGDALALERGAFAGGAALHRRQAHAAAASAHARGGPDGRGVPGGGGLPGQPRRRHARGHGAPRSPAGDRDRARLPAGGDGRRRAAPAARARRRRRGRLCGARHGGAVAVGARHPERDALYLPRRRAARGAPLARGQDRAHPGRPRHRRRRRRSAP